MLHYNRLNYRTLKNHPILNQCLVLMCMQLEKNVNVATPLWTNCEDETHTPKKWELGVLWDSRNFRARHQKEKHLGLRCYVYRWKGLEV